MSIQRLRTIILSIATMSFVALFWWSYTNVRTTTTWVVTKDVGQFELLTDDNVTPIQVSELAVRTLGTVRNKNEWLNSFARVPLKAGTVLKGNMVTRSLPDCALFSPTTGVCFDDPNRETTAVEAPQEVISYIVKEIERKRTENTDFVPLVNVWIVDHEEKRATLIIQKMPVFDYNQELGVLYLPLTTDETALISGKTEKEELHYTVVGTEYNDLPPLLTINIDSFPQAFSESSFRPPEFRLND